MRAAKRSASSMSSTTSATLEWARAPLAEAVAQRRDAVRAVRAAAAGARRRRGLRDQAIAAADSAELAASATGSTAKFDLIAWTQTANARGDDAAATALRQHVHDEVTREMKLTRKPLFAEISKADGRRASKASS